MPLFVKIIPLIYAILRDVGNRKRDLMLSYATEHRTHNTQHTTHNTQHTKLSQTACTRYCSERFCSEQRTRSRYKNVWILKQIK